MYPLDMKITIYKARRQIKIEECGFCIFFSYSEINESEIKESSSCLYKYVPLIQERFVQSQGHLICQINKPNNYLGILKAICQEDGQEFSFSPSDSNQLFCSTGKLTIGLAPHTRIVFCLI